MLLPSSCFLVTLDTLRLIHKTPTSTPNVTFPQLRRDHAPHLPDSSRKSTSRFKKVGIFFFCCLLENGWGNPVETSCLANTDCWCGEKKVLAMNTQQEPTLMKQVYWQHTHWPGSRCDLTPRHVCGLDDALATYRFLRRVLTAARSNLLTMTTKRS